VVPLGRSAWIRNHAIAEELVLFAVLVVAVAAALLFALAAGAGKNSAKIVVSLD
jgi:hypothetical protein